MRLCAEKSESESEHRFESALEFDSDSSFGSVSRGPGCGLSESAGRAESVVVPSKGDVAAMPSVGMRRSTRVLVVKGAEGGRVLRSGRRLWPESGAGRLTRIVGEGDEWLRMIHSSGDGQGGARSCKSNGWHGVDSKREVSSTAVDREVAVPEPDDVAPMVLDDDDFSVDRMWGVVYQRKRKRFDAKNVDVSGNLKRNRHFDDRMYGKYFVRRLQGRGSRGRFVFANSVSHCQVMLAAVIDSSCRSTPWFTRFLILVLSYMTRVKLRLRELSAFMISGSVSEVFASHGIHFLRGPPCGTSGICRIFRSSCFVPMFSVDFSAVPCCFMYMQLRMFLRTRYLQYGSVVCSIGMDMEEEIDADNDENLTCTPSDADFSGSKTVASKNEDSAKKSVLRLTGAAPKVSARNAHRRNGGLNSRVIQTRRTRRRSLRTGRVRNSSLAGISKTKGELVSNFIGIRGDSIPFTSAVSKRKLRSSLQKNSTLNDKELKSSLEGVREDIESTCCSANILVSESDKCYREEGANIFLEFTASSQWVLAVKKDGLVRYSHVAQKAMRPCASNRITHAIIWTGEDGWKLEFPNRQDWCIFKELYRECCDRNVCAPTVKSIPVPGVREVSDYEDNNSATYLRPASYITFHEDEVSRALTKSAANYEVDSEDEEWLNDLNNNIHAENEHHELVSEDTFELMIYIFEKAVFCTPDVYSDEQSAVNLCLGFGQKEVVESVYHYWMRKRKQKRSPLVRFFQHGQPRRAQLLPKSVLRKKRSFKRSANKSGRGKQRNILQAIIEAEKEAAVEKHNALHRVEEANASAKSSTDLAVIKRQRAQLLMEYADLAAYKATMAVRIAEAARITGSSDVSASYFLD